MRSSRDDRWVSAVEYSEGSVRELIEERMDPENDALDPTNKPKTREVPKLALNPSIRTGGNYTNLLCKLQDHVMRNWEMPTYPDLLRSYPSWPSPTRRGEYS